MRDLHQQLLGGLGQVQLCVRKCVPVFPYLVISLSFVFLSPCHSLSLPLTPSHSLSLCICVFMFVCLYVFMYATSIHIHRLIDPSPPYWFDQVVYAHTERVPAFI